MTGTITDLRPGGFGFIASKAYRHALAPVLPADGC